MLPYKKKSPIGFPTYIDNNNLAQRLICSKDLHVFHLFLQYKKTGFVTCDTEVREFAPTWLQVVVCPHAQSRLRQDTNIVHTYIA